MQIAAISPPRTVRRCVVCGFHEVRTDEVVDRGRVLLSECPRCEHRATRPILEREPAAREPARDELPPEPGAARPAWPLRRSGRGEGTRAA